MLSCCTSRDGELLKNSPIFGLEVCTTSQELIFQTEKTRYILVKTFWEINTPQSRRQLKILAGSIIHPPVADTHDTVPSSTWQRSRITKRSRNKRTHQQDNFPGLREVATHFYDTSWWVSSGGPGRHQQHKEYCDTAQIIITPKSQVIVTESETETIDCGGDVFIFKILATSWLSR